MPQEIHSIGTHEIAQVAVDYETITFGSGAAVGLTATKVNPGGGKSTRRSVHITFETAGIAFRYRYDGTAPTTTEGHLAQDGTVLDFQRNLSKLQFILVSGSGGIAKVTYHV